MKLITVTHYHVHVTVIRSLCQRSRSARDGHKIMWTRQLLNHICIPILKLTQILPTVRPRNDQLFKVIRVQQSKWQKRLRQNDTDRVAVRPRQLPTVLLGWCCWASFGEAWNSNCVLKQWNKQRDVFFTFWRAQRSLRRSLFRRVTTKKIVGGSLVQACAGAVLVYKTMNDLSAGYLADGCQLSSIAGRRRLRSSNVATCERLT